MRRLWPWEVDRYLDHLLALPARERFERFHGLLGNDVIRAHCASFDWARTVLLALIDGPSIVGAAELALDAPLPRVAELALSVMPPWQGRGGGKALASYAIDTATRRGAHELRLYYGVGNVPMQRIARSLGGRYEVEAGSIVLRIGLAPGVSAHGEQVA